jgi:RimJ/RimL family protein N-acetyltransferase
MPLLVGPALAAGVLRQLEQPRLAADGGLELRAWHPGDAPMVHAAYGCPEIQRWHVRRFDTVVEAGEWIGQWQQRWADEDAASWAIVDGEPVGQVGLRSISLAEGSAGVSYWVAPGARGKAVAARAVEAVCRWAFDEIGFHRLEIHHSTANEASCRVAARTGFVLEGTLRKAIRHADGWHDWHVHGRLRGDGGLAVEPPGSKV